MANFMSCSIIERDLNGDVIWAWTFPCVTEQQMLFVRSARILDRTGILDGQGSSTEQRSCTGNGTQRFVFGRLHKNWFYISCTEVFESDNLPWVKQFALVLWAKDFNPEKYETMSRILSKSYCKSGNPCVLLNHYLSIETNGSCTTEENGTFLLEDFEAHSKLISKNTMVKELINMFGLEIILIYTALLLRKRLIIYHHSLQTLLKWVRTFQALMPHRSETDDLHPWVDLVPEELASLKGNSSYIVGCIDSTVGSRSDLYDVLVNLPAREITVATQAKESMTMTKTHKEIAVQLTQLAGREDSTEQQVLKEVSARTADLLNHLGSLSQETDSDGRQLVSVETLRQCGLPPPLENFLFNLAVAENMIML